MLGVERFEPLRHAGESFSDGEQGHQIPSAPKRPRAAAGLRNQPNAAELDMALSTAFSMS